MYEDAPNGAICAALLPLVFEKNAKSLKTIIENPQTTWQEKMQASLRLHRFLEVSQMITNNSQAPIDDGIDWLHALLRDIEIPPLSTLCKGIHPEQYTQIVANTKTASSTKGNPVVLSDQDLLEIIERSW